MRRGHGFALSQLQTSAQSRHKELSDVGLSACSSGPDDRASWVNKAYQSTRILRRLPGIGYYSAMGAYHYQLDLLPQQADPESGVVWREQPSATLLAELRALLPKSISWTGVEEFQSEGDLSSDLRIWHEDGLDSPILSIAFRYSPVADDLKLLKRFIAIAATHRLLVYSSIIVRLPIFIRSQGGLHSGCRQHQAATFGLTDAGLLRVDLGNHRRFAAQAL